MTAEAVLDAPLQTSRYDVLHPIARGGMGAVYRGRNRETGESVAIKLIAPHRADHPVFRSRFEQEYQIGRRIHHPHLVRYVDFDEVEGRPFLVMEYVDGPNVGVLVEKYGRFPEEEAVRLIAQVAGALHAVHQQGLLHRDIKPHNILLTADGDAKLIDLGLAKDLGDDLSLTRLRAGMGTHPFIAPEQFTDAKNVGFRSDIYSLAATLYFILTGTFPFPVKSAYKMLAMKLHDRLVAPHQLVPDMRESVNKAILRAMSARPDQRPSSCVEFLEDLAGRSRPCTRFTAWTDSDMPASASDWARGERRATVRIPVNHESLCRSADPDEPFWHARVTDVSATGLRLVTRCRFEPGATLVVDLHDDHEDGLAPLSVRVVRIEAQPHRKWALGCEMEQPLSLRHVQRLFDLAAQTAPQCRDRPTLEDADGSLWEPRDADSLSPDSIPPDTDNPAAR